MKRGYKVLLIVGIILFILILSVVVLSQIKKETYVATMDLEGVNSYPPRLTVLRDRGVVKETALSIIPQLRFPRLSIGPAKTTFVGTITLICGNYQKTQDWQLTSDVYGEGMEQRIVFKGVLPESDCIANVITTECVTDQARCEKGTLYLRFSTPE